MLVIASAITLSSALAQDTTAVIPPTVLPAPVGHAQPTTRGFAPRSSADESEQRRLSAYGAQQRELDEMLNKKLNICRC
jgi:hypothetical protein